MLKVGAARAEYPPRTPGNAGGTHCEVKRADWRRIGRSRPIARRIVIWK